jgi:phage baseplate assembly protein gpV
MGMSDVIAVTTTADTVALDADGISVAASVGNNAALTIGGALASGGSVTLSHGRVVTILSAGDDSGISFTVTGTE